MSLPRRATVGMIAPELFSIPGVPGFDANPVTACSTVPGDVLIQVVGTMAWAEIYFNKGKFTKEEMCVTATVHVFLCTDFSLRHALDGRFADPSRKPGNVGFDPLKFAKNAKAYERLEMNELKNGRLAMLAFSGMLHQVFVTGKPVLASVSDIFAAP